MAVISHVCLEIDEPAIATTSPVCGTEGERPKRNLYPFLKAYCDFAAMAAVSASTTGWDLPPHVMLHPVYSLIANSPRSIVCDKTCSRNHE